MSVPMPRSWRAPKRPMSPAAFITSTADIMWWAKTMIDADGLAQSRHNYLRVLGETWAQACEQAPLLANLSLRHGEVIARGQMETAQATLAALQSVAPM